MPKRLSEKQRDEIVKRFTIGSTIDELSHEFNFTKSTIIRNLKKYLGENEYKKLVEKKFLSAKTFKFKNENKSDEEFEIDNIYLSQDSEAFVEIAPIDLEIDPNNQKDISSIPLEEINFPNLLFMVVHKNIELDIKELGDFPEWEFLPKADLKRKAIEVFYDLKMAKRFCKKDQKVIKVPNTDVFKMVAPILISRGITRIVTFEKLIAL